VIDNGDSYKNLCEGLGGTYLTFDGATQVSINPFSMVRDFDEECSMLVGLLKIMIAPNSNLSDFELSELQRILGLVYRQKNTAMTVDDLASALITQQDPQVKR